MSVARSNSISRYPIPDLFSAKRVVIGVLFCTFFILLFNYLNADKFYSISVNDFVVPQSDDVSSHLQQSNVGSVKIKLPSRGYTELVAIDVSLKGEATLWHKETHWRLQEEEPHCSVINNTTNCHLALWKGDSNQVYEILNVGDVPLTLKNVNVRYIKAKRVTSIQDTPWFSILILVLISLPLVWMLHSKYVISQWLIISISITFLWQVHAVFCVSLLAFLSAMYLLGKKWLSSPDTQKTGALWSLLITAFAFLMAFKYGQDLLFKTFADMGQFGFALPLGLSYFIIRLMDTQIQWYRGDLTNISFREYLCFIIFPPTIPAGPIETLDGFLNGRLEKIRMQDISYGLSRISIGIFKKVVIADLFLYEKIFNQDSGLFIAAALQPTEVGAGALILAMFGAFLFVYIDFSAYSDMAIGLSRLFGYRIMENFTWPILAPNLKEYWRCWHRSLSMWCMRNIYLPLAITTREPNLPSYSVMMAVGLWHGFNLSWFSWAIHHASGLTFLNWLDKKKFAKRTKKIAKPLYPLRVFLTLAFVAAGHSFAQVSDFGTAAQLYMNFWLAFIPLI